ncbi:MAG: T9SS type A sorting domain-containing protein [Ignavibacteria bacterium]|nr:T9SS type A sorting domain-containing protein [Ignavibacteria bacterium]
MKTVFLVYCVIFFSPLSTNAQPFQREAHSITCTISGNALALPFTGGINAPNHQFFDVDGDNDFDMFIFDSDLTLDFYRNTGTSSFPQFQLATGEFSLPPFSMWFLFLDLNGDGLNDFCCDDFQNGVRYYVNNGSATNPHFIIADSSLHDIEGNIVFGGLNSIPAFADIDHDNDLDFFSVNSASGTLNFYRNVGTISSPMFQFITDFWQGIQIIGGKNETQKHGAAALRFGDLDNNGFPDLLYGDLFSFGMYYFHNVADSMMQITGFFPENDPITSFGFNMPMLVDIDSDADLDLFVGGLHPGTSQNSFTFYQNIGTASSFQYQRITDNFLTMIDIGKNSHPAFCDIDGDNDEDFFIGSVDRGVFFFLNTGTQTQPNFLLADSHFANVTGNYDYDPTFVDIDDDNDYDMFVGNFSGKFSFYKNYGTPTTPSLTLTPSPASDTIRVSQSLSPAFVDIDADNDVDLFVGKPNGTLAFYRNSGNATIFLPVLESVSYQNISVQQFAKPFFCDFDGDEDYDLFIGNSIGSVAYFENIGSPMNPQFFLNTNQFANTDKASEVDPTLIDIDNDNDWDLFLGNFHGGVQLYRNKKFTNEVPSSNYETTSFVLTQNFPNPFNPTTAIHFTLSTAALTSLKVYDILGKEVATLINRRIMNEGKHEIEFDATNLASGIYVYRLQSGNRSEIKKMVLLR